MGKGVCFSNNWEYCTAYCNKHIESDPYEVLIRRSKIWCPILQINLKNHNMLYFSSRTNFHNYIDLLKNNFIIADSFQNQMRDFHLKQNIKSIRVKSMYGFQQDEIVVFDKNIIKLIKNWNKILYDLWNF